MPLTCTSYTPLLFYGRQCCSFPYRSSYPEPCVSCHEQKKLTRVLCAFRPRGLTYFAVLLWRQAYSFGAEGRRHYLLRSLVDSSIALAARSETQRPDEVLFAPSYLVPYSSYLCPAAGSFMRYIATGELPFGGVMVPLTTRDGCLL